MSGFHVLAVVLWTGLAVIGTLALHKHLTRTRSYQHQSDAQARAKGAGSVFHTSTNASRLDRDHA